MKKIILLLIVSLCISFTNCEKDDICDANTITTPRLVISFYDITNSTESKNVTNLKIIGDGMEEGIIYNGSTLINSNKVAIPLKTDADVTKYHFILNYDNANAALINEDILEFDYSRENIFISRACGFKTVFTLDPLNPFTHTDAAVADEKWIRHIAVKKSTIDNENETHLEIYF